MVLNLPSGWKWVKVSDVADTKSGGTPSRSHPEFFNGDIPWIKSGELKDSYIRAADEYISNLGLKNSSANVFSKGTVVVALYGATAGKVGLLDIDTATNQAVCAIIPKRESFIPKYMFYWIISQRDNLLNQRIGGAQPNISQGIIRSQRFPLTSIENQISIVEKIEELFSQLDAGVAGLKRAQAELKRYRASVLKAAFEGRLVPQNPNDTPAQILLSSIGKEPLVKEDLTTLPTNWVWTTLGSITHPERNRVHPSDYPNSKYIGMADVESMTMKLLSTRLASEMKSTAESFKAGDVLYGSLRPYLNKVICPHFDGLCSTEFIVFPKTSHLNNDYLRIFLNTSEFVAYSTSLNTGDRPRVKFEQFKNYPFPLPPIDEQERIVNTLEKHISIIQIVEDKIAENLIRTQTIKQAILNRAFEGKLIQKSKDQPTNLKDIDDNFENTKSQNISIQGSLF
jgi:type I restriction enzyme S subunit